MNQLGKFFYSSYFVCNAILSIVSFFALLKTWNFSKDKMLSLLAISQLVIIKLALLGSLELRKKGSCDSDDSAHLFEKNPLFYLHSPSHLKLNLTYYLVLYYHDSR